MARHASCMEHSNPVHTRIQVIIGDTRGIIREGLRFLLEGEGGIEVVAEATDASSLLTKTRTFSPNVLVIDEGLLSELMALGIPVPTVVLCEALPRGSHDSPLVFVEKAQIFTRLLEVVRQHGRKPGLHAAPGHSSRRAQMPRPPSRGNL